MSGQMGHEGQAEGGYDCGVLSVGSASGMEVYIFGPGMKSMELSTP